METHVQRVIEEEKALALKTDALFRFVHSEAFKEVDTKHQTLLRKQLDCMTQYQAILLDRIDLYQQVA